VFLDLLPLMPNGKVDRNSLPAPDHSRPELEQTYVEPQTELERFLADRWKEMLNVEKVGIHDSFFELGGNSIRAAVLINKLRGELGEFIHVAALFEHPKISELSTFLREQHPDAVAALSGGGSGSASPAATGVAPIERVSRNEEGVLARLDDLSDDEVRSMLGDLLTQEGASE